MKIQDYKDELKQDILDYAKECEGESLEQFRDDCWTADSVTGNGSGSYTFNSKQAEENIKDLIFSDELLRMFQDFGYDRVPFEKGPEYIDVSIRCFLLDEVINENEEELKEILKSKHSKIGEGSMLNIEYYTKPDGSKWVMITRYTQRKQYRKYRRG